MKIINNFNNRYLWEIEKKYKTNCKMDIKKKQIIYSFLPRMIVL